MKRCKKFVTHFLFSSPDGLLREEFLLFRLAADALKAVVDFQREHRQRGGIDAAAPTAILIVGRPASTLAPLALDLQGDHAVANGAVPTLPRLAADLKHRHRAVVPEVIVNAGIEGRGEGGDCGR